MNICLLYEVHDWVLRGSRPTFKKIRKSKKRFDIIGLSLEKSCLYRKHEDSIMTVRAQLLVPSANRERFGKLFTILLTVKAT